MIPYFDGLDESALAAMLALPLAEVEHLLKGIKPLRRTATNRWFDWHAIKARLSDELLQPVRERLAVERGIIRPSKRWVAGYADLVAQWDWRKNVNLIPDDVSFGSHLQIWWRCDRGPDHQWAARAQSRTRGTGCPFCAGKRVSVTNSLAARRPDVAADWHPTKNGSVTASDVVWSSNRKAWWKCAAGSDHEWRATVNHRTSADEGCPFCAGSQPSVTSSLAAVFPEIAEEWHPDLNGTLTPDQVTVGSNRIVWWRCRNSADHQWEARVQVRTRGAGCPFCSGARVSYTNSLATRAPEIAEQWHPTLNGAKTPHDFAWKSNHAARWKCPNGPDHEWRARISSRTHGDAGCPFCAGHRASVTNCLPALFPEIAREWHRKLNRPLTPHDVTAYSKRLCWWRCRRRPWHTWRTAVQQRVAGTGCPYCHRSAVRR